MMKGSEKVTVFNKAYVCFLDSLLLREVILIIKVFENMMCGLWSISTIFCIPKIKFQSLTQRYQPNIEKAIKFLRENETELCVDDDHNIT